MHSEAEDSSAHSSFASRMKVRLPNLRRSRTSLFSKSAESSSSIKTNLPSSASQEAHIALPSNGSTTSVSAARRPSPERHPRPASQLLYPSRRHSAIVRTFRLKFHRHAIVLTVFKRMALTIRLANLPQFQFHHSPLVSSPFRKTNGSTRV